MSEEPGAWDQGGFQEDFLEEAGDSGRVSKTVETVQAKVSRKGGSLGRRGETGDTKEGLAHRRHSVDFLKRKVRTGGEKGGG